MQIILKPVKGSPFPCDSTKTEHKVLHELMIEHDSLCYFCERECVIVCRDTKIVGHACLNFPALATREHLHPRSRGGKDKNNLVLACFSCNQLMGNKTVKEKAKFIRFGDIDNDLSGV